MVAFDFFFQKFITELKRIVIRVLELVGNGVFKGRRVGLLEDLEANFLDFGFFGLFFSFIVIVVVFGFHEGGSSEDLIVSWSIDKKTLMVIVFSLF